LDQEAAITKPRRIEGEDMKSNSPSSYAHYERNEEEELEMKDELKKSDFTTKPPSPPLSSSSPPPPTKKKEEKRSRLKAEGMGCDDSDSDFVYTADEGVWRDSRKRVKNQSPDTSTSQEIVEQLPQDQMKSNNSSISTPKKLERRVETLLPSPADIIDGLGLISRNDQNKERELEQIQDTHTTDFKGVFRL